MESSHPTTTAMPPTVLPDSLCQHIPKCPTAESPDREAAAVLVAYPEQGWSLLCNSLLLWEDTGALLPDGQIVAPHRPTDTPGHSARVVFRPAATSALIGGMGGSGKTDLAALHAAIAARFTGASWPV